MSIYMFYGLLCLVMLSVLQGCYTIGMLWAHQHALRCASSCAKALKRFALS
jgi:hypothetical protein